MALPSDTSQQTIPPLYIENSASLAALILKGTLKYHPQLIMEYDVMNNEGGG
jgi:hypothetical protein